MIPISYKITNFSLYLFVYFFDNFSCLICISYRFARKNGWYAPQGTLISQYASYSALLCSIPAIHPAITENMENVLVKCTPQRLIIGKPISQYALYSAMLCLLYSNISKEQHEKHLCNPSSHYGKYGEYIRETRPISWYVKAIIPQFQQCWTRFIT